jgi:GTP cyclohydrolase I
MEHININTNQLNDLLKIERQSLLKNLLDHPIEDEVGLNDIQLLPAQQSIALAHVGIERFRIPMTYPHPFGPLNHDTQAALFVNLRPGKTGLNMSRMVEFLQQETANKVITPRFISEVASVLRTVMLDTLEESPLEWSKISLNFPYVLKQATLASDRWGWQYYDCAINAIHKLGRDQVFLTINYEYSATCPCALSMAKQYEREYVHGKRADGLGVAVAHSQRAVAQITIELTDQAIQNNSFYFSELIALVKLAIPTETQSLAKRIDEQAFAILNGSNPMFVEHAAKYLHQTLNAEPNVRDWYAKLTHFESLHSHNATAEIYKGIPEGLRGNI